MKIFNKNIFAGFICFSIFMIFISGCNLQSYGLDQAFHREPAVESRSSGLKILDKVNTKSDGTAMDSEYDVLIITDVHFGNENKGGNGPRREEAWFEKLKESGLINTTKFVICLGDVAEHGYRSECENFNKELKEPLEKIKTAVAPDGIKIYNIVGNHDLYNNGWYAWADIMYPHTSFYKFETPNFSWYFIDSASGTLGGYQYESLDESMKNDSKRKLVFSHVPIYAEDVLYFTMQNSVERNKLISTCSKTNTKWFIDGHTHKDRTSGFGKFTERNIPGFLSKYGYGVMHINETTGESSVRVEYY